ncbi:hypothetical protein KKH18_09240, partial [bacterium]|nr:hypothetical protein [bacterium]
NKIPAGMRELRDTRTMETLSLLSPARRTLSIVVFLKYAVVTEKLLDPARWKREFRTCPPN